MPSRPRKERMTAQELDARLRYYVGIGLIVIVGLIVVTMLWGLLFVVQPLDAQSPNDKAMLEILGPICYTLVGAAVGIVATRGNRKDD
jgi:hypothetical protein